MDGERRHMEHRGTLENVTSRSVSSKDQEEWQYNGTPLAP